MNTNLFMPEINMKRFYFLIFIFLIPAVAFSQDTLSLSKAIETAITNNYSVVIVRNEEEVAKNDNTIGNAGFLPSVDLYGRASVADNNTMQKYSSGTEVNTSGARTEALNAYAQLTWTLFDGLKMFATKSRLDAEETISVLNTRSAIENTIVEVMQAYYGIVRSSQQISVYNEAISLYEERVKIAEARFNIGSASRLELLQARVDLNARKSSLLSERNNFETLKSELNRLMGRDILTPLYVSDSMSVKYMPAVSELKTIVLKENSEIKIAEKTTDVYRYSVKEFQSLRYPQLNFDIAYNFNRTENEVGFALFNRNQGMNAGLTLTWNLFNGFNTSRQINNSKIFLRNSELQLADIRAKVETALFSSYREFESAIEILKLEEENYVVAKENMDVSMEAFKIGSISGIQMKDAQNSYEESFFRLIEARFRAKMAETQLMKLNGDLIKSTP
jgi:outer membrane protein